MGHTSKSVGLHRRKEFGKLSKARPQQNPQLQGKYMWNDQGSLDCGTTADNRKYGNKHT